MMNQRCIDCHETKPAEQFFKEKSGKPQPRCKPCTIIKNRERREARRAAMGGVYEGFVAEAQRFYLSRRPE